ncbi:MAG: biotin transporter BioY [Lachnospiraceae bacterium]|nr:biotin transporter BioY [Lachnospiraceae bacterium]
MRKKITVKDMSVIAMVTAVISIISPFSIPIPISPIPITLSFFALFLAGIILGKWKGVISTIVYLLLGMAGLPVFTGFTGGIQKFVGPTGGYLVGYVFLVFFIGLFVEKFPGKILMYVVGGILGIIACYAFGTAWFVIQYQTGIMEALTMCVFPYIPLDLVKLVCAVVVGYQVRKVLLSQNLLASTSE